MEFELLAIDGFPHSLVLSATILLFLFLWAIALFLMNASRIWRIRRGIKIIMKMPDGPKSEQGLDDLGGLSNQIGNSILAKRIRLELEAARGWARGKEGGDDARRASDLVTEGLKEFFLFRTYWFFVIYLLWALAVYWSFHIIFFNIARANVLAFDEKNPLALVRPSLNSILDLQYLLLMAVAVVAISIWAHITLRVMIRSLIYSIRKLAAQLEWQ